MPHVIWDEDLGEIQKLIDEVRACINPDKVLKSVRGELEPDEGFAVVEPDEKLGHLTERRSNSTF